MVPVDRKKNNPAIVEGLAEIQVGTARLPSFRPFAPYAFGLLNIASGIEPSAPHADKDIHPSAPDAEKYIQPSAPYAIIDSSKSVMSLVSMLSLPPAYCDLRPRSGSAYSIETRKNAFNSILQMCR